MTDWYPGNREGRSGEDNGLFSRGGTDAAALLHLVDDDVESGLNGLGGLIGGDPGTYDRSIWRDMIDLQEQADLNEAADLFKEGNWENAIGDGVDELDGLGDINLGDELTDSLSKLDAQDLTDLERVYFDGLTDDRSFLDLDQMADDIIQSDYKWDLDNPTRLPTPRDSIYDMAVDGGTAAERAAERILRQEGEAATYSWVKDRARVNSKWNRLGKVLREVPIVDIVLPLIWPQQVERGYYNELWNEDGTIDNDEVVDIDDCKRFPNSPFCKGFIANIIDLFDFTPIDLMVFDDGCQKVWYVNVGISIAQIPGIIIGKRNPDCPQEYDPPPPPEQSQNEPIVKRRVFENQSTQTSYCFIKLHSNVEVFGTVNDNFNFNLANSNTQINYNTESADTLTQYGSIALAVAPGQACIVESWETVETHPWTDIFYYPIRGGYKVNKVRRFALKIYGAKFVSGDGRRWNDNQDSNGFEFLNYQPRPNYITNDNDEFEGGATGPYTGPDGIYAGGTFFPQLVAYRMSVRLSVDLTTLGPEELGFKFYSLASASYDWGFVSDENMGTSDFGNKVRLLVTKTGTGTKTSILPKIGGTSADLQLSIDHYRQIGIPCLVQRIPPEPSPLPEPLPEPPPMSCCNRTNRMLALLLKEVKDLRKKETQPLHQRYVADAWGEKGEGIKVPSTLITQENGDDRTITAYNWPQLFLWFVGQTDGLFGQWPIEIEVEQEQDGITPKKPIKVQLFNVAEAMAELYGLGTATAMDSDVSVAFLQRLAVEVMQIKTMSLSSSDYIRAIVDFMDFPGAEVARDLPMSFSAYKPNLNRQGKDTSEYERSESIRDVLKQTTVQVRGYEFQGESDTLTDAMQKLLYAAAIIKAVHVRNPEPGVDPDKDGRRKGGFLETIGDIASIINAVGTVKDLFDENGEPIAMDYEQFIKDLKNPNSLINRGFDPPEVRTRDDGADPNDNDNGKKWSDGVWRG